MMIFSNLIRKWRSLRYYVIADPSDNSVTLSPRLFAHIQKEVRHSCRTITRMEKQKGRYDPRMEKQNGHYGPDPRVFVFRIPHHRSFGFMLDHGIDEPTQLCQIQYNGKYRCIGFETLCPSVGRILYEYGLPALSPVKLSVSVRRTPQGKTYYPFAVPTPKHLRLCKASSATRAKRT